MLIARVCSIHDFVKLKHFFAWVAGTSLKGFFTRDGVVIVNSSGRLVRTISCNTSGDYASNC